MDSLLRVRGLEVSYATAAGPVRPVAGVDFEIRRREVVGLVGDAGSGKSTVALALLGLARPPGQITAGEVVFEGRDLLKLSEHEVRAIRGRDIGVIVQNPRGALNPMLRVGTQIANVYRAHNSATPAEARRQAVEMLRLVGINDPERRVDSFAHELSGGMAQRALIAMALSSRPKLLIADEPTSGLDVTIQAQFLDEMWRTVQDTGSAMLLVTQDLGIIANYCDRVLVLHDGRIVEDAPVRDFFADPRHEYSRDVLRLFRERGRGFPAQIAAPEPFVRTEALTKHFPLRHSDKVVQAVDRVSLTIGRGEAVALVGESGSGKTTVGRCLLHLIPPTAGRVVIAGTDISGLGRADLRRFRSRMQIVFQDPFDSLDPRWTIARLLEEPLEVHGGGNGTERRDRAAAALRLVDLDPALLDRVPKGLGASTLQRVNIARALILRPEFVVLDEPTSVLAPRARASLVALLARLQAELGIAFLFISHDLTTVRYLCQRVAVMYLGQIVEQGTVEQIFTDPRHPYSQALLSAHLFPDPTRRRVDRKVAEALSGEIPSPIDPPKGCYLAGRCPHAEDRCRQMPQTLQTLPDGREVRCVRALADEIPRMEEMS
jgi:oligopeptide/dipeptide ABC transporter ATP-binding protein